MAKISICRDIHTRNAVLTGIDAIFFQGCLHSLTELIYQVKISCKWIIRDFRVLKPHADSVRSNKDLIQFFADKTISINAPNGFPSQKCTISIGDRLKIIEHMHLEHRMRDIVKLPNYLESVTSKYSSYSSFLTLHIKRLVGSRGTHAAMASLAL